MRKAIFWLHLITGLVAGIVIFVMSVTGTLLMYQRQMTAWADKVVVEPTSGEALPIDQLLEKLRAKEQAPPTTVTMHSDPAMPVSYSYGREKILFAHPGTGEIIGEGSQKVRAFFQSLITWHRYLGTEGESRPLGKAITGACNLGFLFLVLSGIYLWWPRKWTGRAVRAVMALDFSLSGKARDWNWHNAVGFWCAFPLAILVFTATFFSYPWMTPLLYKAMGEEPPAARPAPPRAAPSSKTPEPAPEAKWVDASLNAHWETARQQMAGWKTISLRLPASSTAPLAFTVDAGNGARPDLRETVTINPASGEVEKRETYASLSGARQVRLWVRWLHTGEAGGFLGQTIAGLACAGGALLVWTGFALAWRRFLGRKGEPAS